MADAVQAGVAPPGPAELPADEALKPVTEAVRAVLGVLATREQPAASRHRAPAGAQDRTAAGGQEPPGRAGPPS